MKILLCFGTRPEWIKVKPVADALKEAGIPFHTLKVKQHTTLLEDVDADWVMDIPTPTNNEVRRLDLLVSSIGYVPQEAFNTSTHILVQGDTATALVCAMAGFHRSIPVIHLEAGLRTYDAENPYPEEIYRQMISRVASLHLCATTGNRTNIEKERVHGRIEVVGNTVLDNLNSLKANTELGEEVLVTLHRRENHEIMDRWFVQISKLALANPHLKFTIPLHPNPSVQKHRDKLVGVNVVEPLGYPEFLARLAKSFMVISDSGGIQEECAFLGKRVLVCRTETERPESLGKTSWLVQGPESLPDRYNSIKDTEVKPSFVFGDGLSSRRIATILKEMMDKPCQK